MFPLVPSGKVKRDTAVPVHATKVYRRSRGIAPLILYIACNSRWVVSFILPPLCAWERIPLSIELRLSGSQSWYKRFCKRENLLSLRGFVPLTVQLAAKSFYRLPKWARLYLSG